MVIPRQPQTKYEPDLGQTEWILDSFQSSGMLAQLIEHRLESKFLKDVPPLFRQNYFAQVPSLFLHEVKNGVKLNSFPFCLARDGSMILRRLVGQPALKADSVVTAEGLSLQNKKLLYRTVERIRFSRRRPPKSLLIAGWSNVRFSNRRQADQTMRSLVEHFGCRKLRGLSLQVYIEDDKARGALGQPGISEQITKTALALGLKSVCLLSAGDLPPYGSSDGVCYFEINSRQLIADTYLKHQVFSQGGGSLKDDSLRSLKRVHYFDQSPFHGFEIGKLV